LKKDTRNCPWCSREMEADVDVGEE
jgi:hypothetical protein